jgi:hypothetical protein
VHVRFCSLIGPCGIGATYRSTGSGRVRTQIEWSLGD